MPFAPLGAWSEFCERQRLDAVVGLRVSVVRAGGLAGLVRVVSIDSASLAPEDAQALQAKVDEAGLFDLPHTLGSPATQPDAVDYAVTAEDADRRTTVIATDDALTESVRALISWLDTLPEREERVEPAGGGRSDP